ncbi:hypothetical protein JCM10295v2_004529 [Rhodotorula toruloides]
MSIGRRPSNASSTGSSSSTTPVLALFVSKDDLLALANDDVDVWMSLNAPTYPVAPSPPSLPPGQPLFRLLRDPVAPPARPTKQRRPSTPSPAHPPRPISIPLPRLRDLQILQSPIVKPSTSPSLVSPLFLPPILAESLSSLASPASSASSASSASRSGHDDHSFESFLPSESQPRKPPSEMLDRLDLVCGLNVDVDVDLHVLVGIVTQ